MVESRLFLHSPFSETTVAEGEGPSLLLQFILSELIKAEYLVKTEHPLGPFSWTIKPGSYNKIVEYAFLLTYAFPNLISKVEVFKNNLNSACSNLISLLEPFIISCKSNENLLYFLLKHQKNSSILSLLNKVCPEGLDPIKMLIVDRYQKRGFYPSKWIL